MLVYQRVPNIFIEMLSSKVTDIAFGPRSDVVCTVSDTGEARRLCQGWGLGADDHRKTI
jgi:hypothetical protein